jgi:hypothetical protein
MQGVGFIGIDRRIQSERTVGFARNPQADRTTSAGGSTSLTFPPARSWRGIWPQLAELIDRESNDGGIPGISRYQRGPSGTGRPTSECKKGTVGGTRADARLRSGARRTGRDESLSRRPLRTRDSRRDVHSRGGVRLTPAAADLNVATGAARGPRKEQAEQVEQVATDAQEPVRPNA